MRGPGEMLAPLIPTVSFICMSFQMMLLCTESVQLTKTRKFCIITSYKITNLRTVRKNGDLKLKPSRNIWHTARAYLNVYQVTVNKGQSLQGLAIFFFSAARVCSSVIQLPLLLMYIGWQKTAVFFFLLDRSDLY